MEFANVHVEDRAPEQEPMLFIQRCECNRPDCDRVIVAMIRPQLKPLASDPETIASLVYLPKNQISGLVKKLRELQNE